jgi:hypothetical protein
MNVSLNRIILYVQDVGRLAYFYRDAFGLPVIEEIKDEWAVLKAGCCEIALHRVGKAYRVTDTSCQVESNAKLVMAVDRELTNLRAELIAKGVPMGEIQVIPGTHRTSLRREGSGGQRFSARASATGQPRGGEAAGSESEAVNRGPSQSRRLERAAIASSVIASMDIQAASGIDDKASEASQGRHHSLSPRSRATIPAVM